MPPHVSIILPVRNEERFITSCLKSISAQDYPKESIEVLIAEGMSDDDTLGKIAEYDSIDEDLAITVLKNQKQTVSAGLNLGFRNARGDVFIRMDAHARYGCDYISQCLAVMESTGAANVGGQALALPGDDTTLAQAIALAHHSPFGLGGARFRVSGAGGFVETVWPGCYKREVFDRVGYIDERRTRTEDIDFNSRLRQAGYKIYLSPVIRCWFYCRATLWETWKQRWADGYEITHFLPDNPKAPRLRHFIPLVFVSTILLLILVCLISLKSLTDTNIYNLSNVSNRFGPIARLLLGIELLAYLSAMFIAVIQAGRAKFTVYGSRFKVDGNNQSGNNKTINSKQLIGSLLLLPLVFVTLHFSYGLGSLWGLITLPFWLLPTKTTKNR